MADAENRPHVWRLFDSAGIELERGSLSDERAPVPYWRPPGTHAIAGVWFQQIPDVSIWYGNDPTPSADQAQRIVATCLSDHLQWISRLPREPGNDQGGPPAPTTYELRIVRWPDSFERRGAVDILCLVKRYFIGDDLSDVGIVESTLALARQVLALLPRPYKQSAQLLTKEHLGGLGLGLNFLPSFLEAGGYQEALNSGLDLISGARVAVGEVRPRQELLRRPIKDLPWTDTTLIYPFNPSSETLESFLGAMTDGCRDGAVFSVGLRPTELYGSEQINLSKQRELFGEIAVLPGPEDSFSRIQAHVGRIFCTRLERALAPWLMRCTVAGRIGPNPFGYSTLSVPSALATVAVGLALDPGQQTSHSNAVLIEANTAADRQAAFRNLVLLEFSQWRDERRTAYQRRWRSLVDSTGALTFFRLPIQVGRPLPGLINSIPPPFLSNRQIGLADTPDGIRGGIRLGENPLGGTVFCPKEAFNLHGLIAGSSGSGKSTLTQGILAGLRRQSIQPLVIEPTKREYRALRHLEEFKNDLLVLAPGDRRSPLRINPFAIPSGVRLSEHISLLVACFLAAFPLYGPMPVILEEGIRQSYQKTGWKDSDLAEDPMQHSVPDLALLTQEVASVITTGGYSGEVKANLDAALRVRLDNLRHGLIGETFSQPDQSITPAQLLSGPTVIELASIVNPNENALLMAFLLALLGEYLGHAIDRQSEQALRNIVVIEEAHRLLTDSGRMGSDVGSSRALALEIFANLLTEVRSRGVGVLVVDQEPHKLIREVIESTSLKIGLSQAGASDRETMSRAIGLTLPQDFYVQRLPSRHAVVHVIGWFQPLLCQIEDQVGRKDLLLREQAEQDNFAQFMNNVRRHRRLPLVSPQEQCSPEASPLGRAIDTAECLLCGNRCYFRPIVSELLTPATEQELATHWVEAIQSSRQYRSHRTDDGEDPFVPFAQNLVAQVQRGWPPATPAQIVELSLCLFAQMRSRKMAPHELLRQKEEKAAGLARSCGSLRKRLKVLAEIG
jgi:hypothetical protein